MKWKYVILLKIGDWLLASKNNFLYEYNQYLIPVLHNVEFSRNVAFDIKELASVHDKNLKLTLS